MSRVSSRRPSRPAGREWLAGVFSLPWFVTDRDPPYRPAMALVVESSSGIVLAHEVGAPEDRQGVLVRSLEKALADGSGDERPPDRLRIGDADLVDPARRVVGERVSIEVDAVPELHGLVHEMVSSMPGSGGDGYLETGFVSAPIVARFCRSAELLYRLAPWKRLPEDHLIRVDIPHFGIEAACLSVIGEYEESRGFVVFSSIDGYEAFVRAGEPRPERGSIDFGTEWIALEYVSRDDLPEQLLAEFDEHGWEVAGPDAFPLLARRESDGAARPLTETDFEIASACARTLAAFAGKHGEALVSGDGLPVCESYFDEREIEVRMTVPYDAAELFDVDAADAIAGHGTSSKRSRIGRNDPCPCGSGKKYKKCHMASDERVRAAERARAVRHERAERVLEELADYADEHFGDAWFEHLRHFRNSSMDADLMLSWALYHAEFDDTTVVRSYLEERGRRLDPLDRAWLEAEEASWCSVWQILDLEEHETGVRIFLIDMLSDEKRVIEDSLDPRVFRTRTAILGRVVDADGISVLSGAHPEILPLPEAADVVRRARNRLRRKRAVPVDRLRSGDFGRYLIGRWDAALDRLDEEADAPLVLRNHDGDAILVTTDVFELADDGHVRLPERLEKIDGLVPPDQEDDPAEWAFVDSNVCESRSPARHERVQGVLRLGEDEVSVRTNSVERADTLRRVLEESCGDLLRFKGRVHADPVSSEARRRAPAPPQELAPDEAHHLVLNFKDEHYADWHEHPLPALGGITPQEATKTESGRAQVGALLDEMEGLESKLPAAQRYDFSEIRRRLGLE